MAKCTPRRWRPGTSRSRGRVAPPASTTASNSPRRAVAESTDASVRSGAGNLRGAHGAPASRPRRAVRNSVPSCFHLGEAPVQHRLLELELGDAVAQQATDALGPLEDHDRVSGPGELLGGREPGRTRSDDRHLLAGPGAAPDGAPAHQSSAAHSAISSSTCLISTGSEVMPEHARALARRRAEPAGELGEVVRRVQAVARLGEPARAATRSFHSGMRLPERATLVTEGDAAAHAPGRLLGELLAAEGEVDLRASPGRGSRRAGVADRCARSGGIREDQPWAAAMISSSTDPPASTARLVASSTRR